VNIEHRCLFAQPINLLFDGTFFSRSDGVIVYRANAKNMYWQFVTSEKITHIEKGLSYLKSLGYQFASFTIDGRKGVIQLLNKHYPNIPIQLCHFHQAQIIRRYTTQNPKTDCGKELKTIMKCLTETTEDVFQNLVETWYQLWEDFLLERNDNGQFMHRRLRSAYRSLKTNMPYLFTFQRYSELNIPNTTNSCDGSFAHWKQKLKIHRGLRKHRRDKVIDFLLNDYEKP
jgi:hypothetical protein